VFQLLGGVGGCAFVVDEDSARASADSWQSFPKDHFNISKPVGADDDVFSWVLAKLKEGAEKVERAREKKAIIGIRQLGRSVLPRVATTERLSPNNSGERNEGVPK
jgi:hypothetical protein